MYSDPTLFIEKMKKDIEVAESHGRHGVYYMSLNCSDEVAQAVSIHCAKESRFVVETKKCQRKKFTWDILINF